LNQQTVTLNFGPKHYFWNYKDAGLYLAVKPLKDYKAKLEKKYFEKRDNSEEGNLEWLLGNRFL
jgi:hypothetical protein